MYYTNGQIESMPYRKRCSYKSTIEERSLLEYFFIKGTSFILSSNIHSTYLPPMLLGAL